MKVWCPHDDLVLVSKVLPHPGNENAHTREQVERLAKILKYQGWRKPLIISKRSGFLATGHCSLAAAIHNGWEAVPVSYQDFESDEQETAHRVADNAIASWAHIDLGIVNLNLANMDPSFDLEMFGLKDFQLEPADKYGDKDADAVPDARKTTIQLGDMFLLGRHKLICGDATDKQTVERLMSHYKCDCGEIHA